MKMLLKRNLSNTLGAMFLLSFAAACGQGESKNVKSKTITVEPSAKQAGQNPAAVSSNPSQKTVSEGTQANPAADADQSADQSSRTANTEANELASENEADIATDDSSSEATIAEADTSEHGSDSDIVSAVGSETIVTADGTIVEVESQSACSDVPIQIGGVLLNTALDLLINGSGGTKHSVAGYGQQIVGSTNLVECAGELLN